MKLLIALLFAVTSLPAQTTIARVTFFREDSPSAFKQMFQYKIDYAAAGVKWNIYMDGKKMVTLHRGRMVTFAIPAGHHDFKTDKSVMLSMDIKSGASLFLRPGMDRSKSKLEGTYIFKDVSCSSYLDRTEKIKNVNATDVFTGTVVPETSFSKLCNSPVM